MKTISHKISVAHSLNSKPIHFTHEADANEPLNDRSQTNILTIDVHQTLYGKTVFKLIVTFLFNFHLDGSETRISIMEAKEKFDWFILMKRVMMQTKEIFG
ncbi:unnamed protein product [Adineta steineri]|uniref:Uncharacterized protein n=1 Tax=Adineta steineri TaxID=433720 RepID=A0A815J7J7_9BILA|nr:unnamed protein product [Adineta steineri]CAF4161871.1 unnamed protein product [Adineta steineri]